MVQQHVFNFLTQLKNNNNREWFALNKPTFKEHEQSMKDLFAALHAEMDKFDTIEKHKLMRIYRDVRFSMDKTPFKPRFAGGFTRATAALRGSYFLRIEPGNSIAGGGFYGPNTDDLKRIRQEFEMDDTEIRAIIENAQFKRLFGTLKGDALKTAPRGFDPQHPAIDLIRMKQFYVTHSFTDAEVQQPNFKEKVIEVFKVLRPYFDYMSSVLTTNANGESIL